MAAQGVAAALPSPQAAGGNVGRPEPPALPARSKGRLLGPLPAFTRAKLFPRRCGLAGLPRACPTAPGDTGLAVTLHPSLTS